MILTLSRAPSEPKRTNRLNPGGPEYPATVSLRLMTESLELWSAVHCVTP